MIDDKITGQKYEGAPLEIIRSAINSYYAALDNREHGGVAQDKAFREIQNALGMSWVRGETLKPKRQMTIASFCAMTCAEGGFHKFLQEVEGVNVTDAASAKDYILGKCGIESRTELNIKGPEQEAWLRLQAQYQDWLRT